MWLHLYFLNSHSTDCSDWVFFSQPDPTHGLVNYVTKEEAIQKKLAVVDNGVAILSVDDTTKLGVGALRDS